MHTTMAANVPPRGCIIITLASSHLLLLRLLLLPPLISNSWVHNQRGSVTSSMTSPREQEESQSERRGPTANGWEETVK